MLGGRWFSFVVVVIETFWIEDVREERLSGRVKLKVEQVERRGDAVDAQSLRGDKRVWIL